MRTINKAILLGHVGKDMELRTTTQGLKVGGFTLATKAYKKDGKEVIQWHNCVSFGKVAESLSLVVIKGARMYIEGEIQYSEYEREGVRMISSKIVVSVASLLDEKKSTKESSFHIDENELPF